MEPQGGQFAKASVHYGIGMPRTHCGNCAHFTPAGSDDAGSCEIVIGPVRAEMWCEKWEPERD